jgi:hypothetical protein
MKCFRHPLAWRELRHNHLLKPKRLKAITLEGNFSKSFFSFSAPASPHKALADLFENVKIFSLL